MADENDNLPAIVPFGKYRGQPLAALVADRGYLEWATAQPGLVERFRWLVNLVRGLVPEDLPTPEHNRLQAKFLDHGICQATASLLRLHIHPRSIFREYDVGRDSNPEIEARFEERSVDVVLYTRLDGTEHGLPENEEDFIVLARLELKPQIGDDFPAILRRFKKQLAAGKKCSGARAIVTERFEANGLTFEQAQEMADNGHGSQIALLLMSEIEAERDRIFDQ